MRAKLRRTLTQLAISAAVAVVTPAAAAGIVEGVSQAATTVADATTPSIISNDLGGTQIQTDSRIATRAPARLSDLAGEDDTAWAAAGRKLHVKH
jgi:hypothetical protein